MKNFESPFLKYHYTLITTIYNSPRHQRCFFHFGIFLCSRRPCLSQRKSEGDARRWAWEHSVEMSFCFVVKGHSGGDFLKQQRGDKFPLFWHSKWTFPRLEGATQRVHVHCSEEDASWLEHDLFQRGLPTLSL